MAEQYKKCCRRLRAAAPDNSTFVYQALVYGEHDRARGEFEPRKSRGMARQLRENYELTKHLDAKKTILDAALEILNARLEPHSQIRATSSKGYIPAYAPRSSPRSQWESSIPAY